MKILVPVDFSTRSLVALVLALKLAKRQESTVTVLYVARATDADGWAGRRLRQWLREYAPECECPALVVRVGDPPERIAEQAVTEAADAIVIGTRGSAARWRWWRRRTAERVVKIAPCPVWLVWMERGAETPKVIVLNSSRAQPVF